MHPAGFSEVVRVQEARSVIGVAKAHPVSNARAGFFGITATLGFSFWFFLGYPFANHNESYVWIAQLSRMGVLDALSQRLYPVATYRPFGQVTAWLGYTLSGGSTWPVQLFNFFVAALSWYVLCLAMEQKRVFSLVSLAVGGVFFSGYIYLFHLHGVFYSPLLLLVAVYFHINEGAVSERELILMFLLAVLASLFHPFALLIFIAFVAGLPIEKARRMTTGQLIMAGTFAVCAFALIGVLTSARGASVAYDNVHGLLTSYRMVELNTPLSLLALLLAIVTVAGVCISKGSKLALLAIATVSSLWAFLWGLPVLAVWILTCLLKTLLMRKYSIAFLIIATSLFPVLTGTGSPTYTVFVLMVCASVVSLGWSTVENRLTFLNQTSTISLLAIVMAVIFCLRSGVDLPVVSQLARPLLAEKEKTYQLEAIIDWMMDSSYSEYTLAFTDDALNPAVSDSAVRRAHRPPTTQQYLNAYMDSIRSHRGEERSTKGTLVVSFGNWDFNEAEVVHMVEGKYSGKAVVCLPAD